jgi:hypothetical protein
MVVLVKNNLSLRKALDIESNNYIESLNEQERLLTISKFQLQERLANDKKLDSIISSLKLKIKDVRTITTVEYRYVLDTVVIPLKQDSVDTYLFSYISPCISFDGKVDIEKKLISVNNITNKDTLRHVVYMKKKPTGRKFLFFNIKRKMLELHTSSECGDIKVEQLNIHKDE